jgi:hypothetical protein
LIDDEKRQYDEQLAKEKLIDPLFKESVFKERLY